MDCRFDKRSESIPIETDEKKVFLKKFVKINDYAQINAFKQDDALFQKMMQIVIEHVGVQDSLEDIWSFWKVIASTKKTHINWITKMELHKYLYSEKSILNFFNRFKDENLFEIDEYTIVEKTILNLKRISLQIEKLIPK